MGSRPHPPLPTSVFAGAPPLCDRNLPGGGVHPGPRGTRGEPGVVHWDARSGGGTRLRVRLSYYYEGLEGTKRDYFRFLN